jgi:hypothetical protein
VVNPEGQTIDAGSDLCLIPDLRDIPLAQLAVQADGANLVTAVVSRIVRDTEDSSIIPAMMFNSAI